MKYLRKIKTTAIPREEPKVRKTQNLTDWVSREKEEEQKLEETQTDHTLQKKKRI